MPGPRGVWRAAVWEDVLQAVLTSDARRKQEGPHHLPYLPMSGFLVPGTQHCPGTVGDRSHSVADPGAFGTGVFTGGRLHPVSLAGLGRLVLREACPQPLSSVSSAQRPQVNRLQSGLGRGPGARAKARVEVREGQPSGLAQAFLQGGRGGRLLLVLLLPLSRCLCLCSARARPVWLSG